MSARKKRIGHQTPRAVKVSNQCVLVSAKAPLLLKACAVKHIAKAKDPRVPLVITADLAATSKATITLVDTVPPVAASVISKFDQAPPMLPPA